MKSVSIIRALAKARAIKTLSDVKVFVGSSTTYYEVENAYKIMRWNTSHWLTLENVEVIFIEIKESMASFDQVWNGGDNPMFFTIKDAVKFFVENPEGAQEKKSNDVVEILQISNKDFLKHLLKLYKDLRQ